MARDPPCKIVRMRVWAEIAAHYCDFDLVRWVQGTSAMPYVEEVPSTSAQTWARLQCFFGGEFIGFAFWFN